MINIKEQIEQLKEKITELESKIGQEEKIDFNKWIGRNNDTLAIKGDKYLKSYSDGVIGYGGYKEAYDDNVSYKEGKLRGLKHLDIFILKSDLDDIKLYNFSIFIGKDEDGDYVVQYLGEEKGTEVIKSDTYCKDDFENTDILIFNRF